MKILVGLAVVSVVVMVVMIFQTVVQEMDLHKTKAHMVESVDAVQRKEKSIGDLKITIKDMKTKLVSVTSTVEQLKKNKADVEKSTKDFVSTLQTCNSNKAAIEKKEVEAGEQMAKLKANHLQAKTEAEEKIKGLKQQILDRDKALCALADKSKEEARKLCGMPEAQK